MPINNKEEFKMYCLRALGFPVSSSIEIDDDQMNDRVEYALQKYYTFHYDGSEKVFMRFEVSDNDKINRYLTISPDILGVTDILDMNTTFTRANSLFSIRYQIAQNDFYNLTSVSIVPYYQAMQHLNLLDQVLVGKSLFDFNKNTRKLYIHMDWDQINTGEYIIAVGYRIVSPDEYPEVWNDLWLKKYATALMKKQWGTNLKKFNGGTLPGGIQFNGQQIYNEAEQEIKELEQELIETYSAPSLDLMG